MVGDFVDRDLRDCSGFRLHHERCPTIFTAYNSAFLVSGYYPGWWTGAEEIEMASPLSGIGSFRGMSQG